MFGEILQHSIKNGKEFRQIYNFMKFFNYTFVATLIPTKSIRAIAARLKAYFSLWNTKYKRKV